MEYTSYLLQTQNCSLQLNLVGSGYSGPPINLDKVVVTDTHKEICCPGLDETQLCMLKAQVRAKKADFLEVVDRAVALREEQLLNMPCTLASAASQETDPVSTIHAGNAAATVGARLHPEKVLSDSLTSAVGLKPSSEQCGSVFNTLPSTVTSGIEINYAGLVFSNTGRPLYLPWQPPKEGSH